MADNFINGYSTISKNKTWLYVIGLRVGYPLSVNAKQKLLAADMLMGDEKNLMALLEMNDWLEEEKKYLKQKSVEYFIRPFEQNIIKIKSWRSNNLEKKMALVSTGDPNFYGVVNILKKEIFLGHSIPEMVVIPAIAIASLVAAKQHWSLQHCHVLSVHGSDTNRPITILLPKIYAQSEIILLLRHKYQTKQVAELLIKKDFAQSEITFFGNLGMVDEKSLQHTAIAWTRLDNRIWQELPDFACLAIKVIGNGSYFMCHAGHPIEYFQNDGQITKPEIRAVILSQLRPYPNAVLWDLGSGSGSILLEWALLGGRGIAVEKNPFRLQQVKTNAENFGLTSKIHSQLGEIKQLLPMMQNWLPPQSVFLGGGVSDKNMVRDLWQLLPKSAIFVSAAVSVEGMMAQFQQWQDWGGRLFTVGLEEIKNLSARKSKGDIPNSVSQNSFHRMVASQKTQLHVVVKA